MRLSRLRKADKKEKKVEIGKLKLGIPPGILQMASDLQVWQKLAILIGSWVVPIAFFWFFSLSGNIEELTRLSHDIPRLKDEVGKLEAQQSKIPQLEQEMHVMEGILAEALRLLPESKDIPSVLNEISTLGNEARLEFNLFSPQAETIEKFYAVIPVTMEFTGSFYNIMVFFDRISHMTRIVQIREVSMDNPRQSKEVWSLKGQPDLGTDKNIKDGKEIDVGPPWLIDVKCQAAIFRFLSDDEQKAISNQTKGKKK